jgi:hypothetical protein
MIKTGMRPIQIWVPDTRRPAFVEVCRRQSMALTGDEQENEILSFIEEATGDIAGWE